MPVSVLYMAMSVDGYIAGPNDERANPGGDGFIRLHEWFVAPDGEFRRPVGTAGVLNDELMTRRARSLADGEPSSRSITGAVIITDGVCRSSCRVTGRPAQRSPTTRW